MNWTGKKVLITGACGFIGSHLAERLVTEGADVRAMVQYNSPGSWGWLDHSALSSDMDVCAGDLRDRDSVESITNGVDYVFHLGALIAIPYSYHAPDAYVQTNVTGTLNVLQAARNAEVSRVIHTSTSEVYGTAQYVPIDEKHPLQGQSPYSASKIAGDKMAEAFHLSFDLPVVTVRPFNTYGPRQSARAVIPTTITQCLAGNEIKLGALSPTRDLNFVGDTVSGFLKAASAGDMAIGKTVNIGAGKEISIGELAKTIIRLTGNTARVVTDEKRLRPSGSEVERLLANNSLAAELIDWRPQTSLEEGLIQTIEWIRANMQFYKPGLYAI